MGAGTQDTMGFTITATGTAFGSGHPAPGEQPELASPNLGLLRSADLGATWQSISLSGEVGFHALDAGLGDDGAYRVYGFDTGTAQMLVSTDSGENWRTGPPLQLIDVAVHPSSPDTVYLATPTGVQRSSDAGVSAEPMGLTPQLPLIETTDEGSSGSTGMAPSGRSTSTAARRSSTARPAARSRPSAR